MNTLTINPQQLQVLADAARRPRAAIKISEVLGDQDAFIVTTVGAKPVDLTWSWDQAISAITRARLAHF
jgi:hypothetical protein